MTVESPATLQGGEGSTGQVAVFGDDLIWASRLVAAVESAGLRPARAASEERLVYLLRSVDLKGVIVDLSARRVDPIRAIELVAKAGRPVISVGPHEDAQLRDRATDAGASRVYTYNGLFRNGPRLIRKWVDDANRPAVCRGCGAGIEEEVLALTERNDSGRRERVCQRIVLCANGHVFWRWLDRKEPLEPWTDDWDPFHRSG